MHERFEHRLVEIADAKLRLVETLLHELSVTLRNLAPNGNAGEFFKAAARAKAVATKLSDCDCSAAEFSDLMASLAEAMKSLDRQGSARLP